MTKEAEMNLSKTVNVLVDLDRIARISSGSTYQTSFLGRLQSEHYTEDGSVQIVYDGEFPKRIQFAQGSAHFRGVDLDQNISVFNLLLKETFTVEEVAPYSEDSPNDPYPADFRGPVYRLSHRVLTK